MSLETWIAYAVATEILLIIPGPTVLLVVGYALTRGRGPALRAVAGSCLATACAFGVTFAGLGAVLAASATAFTVMKWVGAAYLVYLGVQMWRAKSDTMLKVEGAEESLNVALIIIVCKCFVETRQHAFIGTGPSNTVVEM